jgi:hypothetical protein
MTILLYINTEKAFRVEWLQLYVALTERCNTPASEHTINFAQTPFLVYKHDAVRSHILRQCQLRKSFLFSTKKTSNGPLKA